MNFLEDKPCSTLANSLFGFPRIQATDISPEPLKPFLFIRKGKDHLYQSDFHDTVAGRSVKLLMIKGEKE